MTTIPTSPTDPKDRALAPVFDTVPIIDRPGNPTRWTSIGGECDPLTCGYRGTYLFAKGAVRNVHRQCEHLGHRDGATRKVAIYLRHLASILTDHEGDVFVGWIVPEPQHLPRTQRASNQLNSKRARVKKATGMDIGNLIVKRRHGLWLLLASHDLAVSKTSGNWSLDRAAAFELAREMTQSPGLALRTGDERHGTPVQFTGAWKLPDNSAGGIELVKGFEVRDGMVAELERRGYDVRQDNGTLYPPYGVTEEEWILLAKDVAAIAELEERNRRAEELDWRNLS